MVYTVEVIDGKIEIPKPWRNKKRFRVFETKNQIILEEDLDDTPEELQDKNVEIYDNGEGIRFKKGLSGEALTYFQQKLVNA